MRYKASDRLSVQLDVLSMYLTHHSMLSIVTWNESNAVTYQKKSEYEVNVCTTMITMYIASVGLTPIIQWDMCVFFLYRHCK